MDTELLTETQRKQLSAVSEIRDMTTKYMQIYGLDPHDGAGLRLELAKQNLVREMLDHIFSNS